MREIDPALAEDISEALRLYENFGDPVPPCVAKLHQIIVSNATEGRGFRLQMAYRALYMLWETEGNVYKAYDGLEPWLSTEELLAWVSLGRTYYIAKAERDRFYEKGSARGGWELIEQAHLIETQEVASQVFAYIEDHIEEFKILVSHAA